MIAQLHTTHTDFCISRERDKITQTTQPVLEQVIDLQEDRLEVPFFNLNIFDGVQTSLDNPFELPIGSQWESATKWQGEIKKRFDHLSVKEALGEAATAELEEFHFLMQKRRKLQQPRSTKEIERDIKNERAMRKVLEGLSEYVRAI